jgi:hypothetical protein
LSGCGIGIAALVAVAAAPFAATTWPAFVLGLLRLPERAATRVERALTTTTLALLLVAAVGVCFLALRGC